MEPLIDAKEVARLLGISPWRVHQLARDGFIVPVRLGRSVRFDPRRLEEFIASGGKALEAGWRRREPEASKPGRVSSRPR